MQDSVRLGKISGIPIGLHWSIALIGALFAFTLAGTILPAAVGGASVAAYWLVALATTIALMASIIAHELGHSIVAQNNNVGVSGITLFALGGVAKLEKEPEDAGAAGRIALAGPAVSVVIGVGSLVAAAVAGSLGVPALVVAGVTWLGIINLVMAVFNMIPALPLDGGRALQALLWHRDGNRHRATVRAASLGRYIGWGLVAFGVWQFLSGGAGLWTALIGWFIASSARAEGFRARMLLERERLGPIAWPFGGGPVGGGPGGGQPPFDGRHRSDGQPPFNDRPPSDDGRPRPGEPNPFQRYPFGGIPQRPAGDHGPFGPPPTSPPAPSDQVIDVDGHRVG
ncbi:MAG: site-2 protease family protein [Actinomycetota bacterium]